MKEKIRNCMNELMHKNSICNYVFVREEKETYVKNLKALDAYLKAVEMSKDEDVKCFMAPLGPENKAINPVFVVKKNGAMCLDGTEIS